MKYFIIISWIFIGIIYCYKIKFYETSKKVYITYLAKLNNDFFITPFMDFEIKMKQQEEIKKFKIRCTIFYILIYILSITILWPIDLIMKIFYKFKERIKK